MRKFNKNNKKDSLLKRVMNGKDSVTLTICGSMKNLELMQKYQAYYTLYNNIVHMPVIFSSIEKDVNGSLEIYKKDLRNIHCKKINMSEAIIIIFPEDENTFIISYDTEIELSLARSMNKIILYNKVPEDMMHKYDFNDNQTYPLYTIKEEYKEWD